MKLTLNGEFEYHSIRCPVTGILATMGCRCQSCRPDLHWLPNTAAAQTTTYWVLPNTTAAQGPGWSGNTYTILAGG